MGREEPARHLWIAHPNYCHGDNGGQYRTPSIMNSRVVGSGKGTKVVINMTDTSGTLSVAKSEVDTKLKVKEIPFVHDQGFFKFETGDTYDGYFEAKKKDRSVKMHGYGMYTTAEGDVYLGTWDSNKLGQNVNINYNDGAKYEGFFKEWCYSGKGKYLYPDGCLLECDFLENVPSGCLQLTDPNGHIWLGKAEQGYGWVYPVNHFYDTLEKTRDVCKVKTRPKVEPMSNVPSAIVSPAKSKKSKVGFTP